jgi:hypothetical protein
MRTRVFISAIGGVLALVALVFVTVIVIRTGASHPIPLGGFAWIVPVVAGMTVGLLGWLLLGGVMRPEAAEPILSDETGCPACGRVVRDNWRLCPYCGAFIESDDTGVDSRYVAARR